MKVRPSPFLLVSVVVPIFLIFVAITMTIYKARNKVHITEPPKVPSNSFNQIRPLPSHYTYVAEKSFCHESPLFLVIEGRNNGETGNHFLVKSKLSQDHAIPCNYSVEQGDFEIPSDRPEYFLALQKELLILDGGTGPYRVLTIWNLNNRKKVFVSGYTDLEIDSTHIWYWDYTGEASDSNCPHKKEWEASGLGAAIETRIKLRLSDFSLLRSSEARCSPVQ